MLPDHNTQNETHAIRRGIATLEFAMALPILLLLMVGITWLGFSVIGQSEVLIEARNTTWKKRFENASDKPLYFPILPLYDQASDFVSQKASKTVNVSPIFKVIPGPEASHTILAGSWDHQAMELKEPPDLELMATAAAVGWGGTVLDFMSQITNPLGLITNLGNSSKSEATNAPSVVGKDDGSSGGSGGGTAPGAPAGGGLTPKQAEAKTEAQRKAEIDALKTRYREMGKIFFPFSPEFRVVGGKLKKAEDDISEAARVSAEKSLAAREEKDEEKKKTLQEESARQSRKVELLRIEYKRLDAEADDIIDELDALGVEKFDLNR